MALKLRFLCLALLGGMLLPACMHRSAPAASPAFTPMGVEVIINIGDAPQPTPTKTSEPTAVPTPAATPSPTPVPISEESDPAWLHEEHYVLRQEVEGDDQFIAIYPPGTDQSVRIIDGCLMSSSEASQGRVAMIIGLAPIRADCTVFDVLDLVLYVIDLADLSADRILSIVAPLENTSIPELPLSGPTARVISQISREVPVWSPDGRFIAFVGALEEYNSDLYLYDTQSRQFRRMTDGPNYSSDPTWSADSRGLLVLEQVAESGFIDDMADHGLWWVALNRELSERIGPEEWPDNRIERHPISSNSWVIRNYADNSATGPIYLINPRSGSIEQLCPFSSAAAVLNQGTTDYLLAYCSFDNEPVDSPTLFTFRSGSLIRAQILTELDGESMSREPIQALNSLGEFLVSHDRFGLIAVSTEGYFRVVDEQVVSRTFLPSPDGKWIAGVIGPFGAGEGAFEIYSVVDRLLTAAGGDSFEQSLEWSPDGSGLLLGCTESSSTFYKPSIGRHSLSTGCPVWERWSSDYSWAQKAIQAVVYPLND